MNTARAIFLGYLVVTAAIVLLYEVVLTSLRGQTIGKMAAHTKVVRADNGSRPGPVRSISRAVIPAAIPAAAVPVRAGGLCGNTGDGEKGGLKHDSYARPGLSRLSHPALGSKYTL